MSRQILMWYTPAGTKDQIRVSALGPYHLLGGQKSSLTFWSQQRLVQIGITELSILGHSDPVYFHGWDGLAQLDQEITLLRRHLSELEFPAELKATWLSHLVFCHALLCSTAPKDSVPALEIG